MKEGKMAPMVRLAKVMEELLPEFRDMMESELKLSAERNNLELSRELIESIKSSLGNEALKLQREVVTQLNFYGRFQDLKYLEYYSQWRQPNNRGKKYKTGNNEDETPSIVLAMEEFIKGKGGMAAFKYTPGRFLGQSYTKKLTEAAKIRRLAWTFAADRLQKQRVRNRRKKYWYTEALKIIRNKAASRVREMTARGLLDFLKSDLDNMEIRL